MIQLENREGVTSIAARAAFGERKSVQKGVAGVQKEAFGCRKHRSQLPPCVTPGPQAPY